MVYDNIRKLRLNRITRMKYLYSLSNLLKYSTNALKPVEKEPEANTNLNIYLI